MTSAGLVRMVLLIISLTSAQDVMSGCEDQKICLCEVYLQITTSRDCQWMESALDVHISVSNNITSIIANVFYIGILLRRLYSTALRGVGWSVIRHGTRPCHAGTRAKHNRAHFRNNPEDPTVFLHSAYIEWQCCHGFRALAVHSRWRPDPIAAAISTKTTLQVKQDGATRLQRIEDGDESLSDLTDIDTDQDDSDSGLDVKPHQ